MGLRDFFGIIRELSFDDLRAEALTSPRILVVARDELTAQRWRDLLFDPDPEGFVDARSHTSDDVDPLHYDAIVTVGPLDNATLRRWRERYRRVDEPMRIIDVDPAARTDEKSLDAIRRRLADTADDRALAIGRYLGAMRHACAMQTVQETASANAQFALISNVPAVVPVVGNLVAAGADFLVLTKNQLMMIFKLAAIYQRDLDNRWRIYSEMMPVVGAGLFWRTVAREVAALLPLAVGTVPKVVIAYAGTWAAGRAALTYYERGVQVEPSQMRAYYAEAVAWLERNPLPFPSRRRAPRDETSIKELNDGYRELPEETRH